MPHRFASLLPAAGQLYISASFRNLEIRDRVLLLCNYFIAASPYHLGCASFHQTAESLLC